MKLTDDMERFRFMNLNVYLSYADWHRVKKGNYYSYFGTGPDSALGSVKAFVAEMGFALPMRHKLPQVLPKKMPPGGKRMARLSDWLPFVTRPRAFGCWLDRSRAADGGGGGG